MAVTTLQEATAVLEGAHRAIAALLAEVEPQYRAACRAFATFERSHNFLREDQAEHRDAYEREVGSTGFDAFSDAAHKLASLLETVDDIEKEEESRLADAS